jgi:hypothetical protein
MSVDRPRRARASRALSALSCATALLLAACHNTSTAPPGTPILTISSVGDRNDYAAYIMAIDSISFTQNDGTVVSPLLTSETMDLTRLNTFTELVEAPAVPSGTYISVTLVVDYTAAYVAVNHDGVSVTAGLSDFEGDALTTATVVVTFDPQNPLVVTANESVRLNVDISLEASNTISQPVTDPAAVSVQPFVVVSPAPAVDNNVMRSRGVFVTTQTIDSGFFMNTRPFYDLVSQLGAVIVYTNAQTYWNINGTTYVGAAGLQALPNTPGASVPVVAYGTLGDLSGITPTFNATSVYVGTSQESPLAEYVTGTVTQRDGNSLELSGVTYLTPIGTISYFNDALVTLDDTTIVSQDGVAANGLSIANVSTGQQVNISGQGSVDTNNNLTLDASGAQVRLAQTTLWGTLNSFSPGTASLDMSALDNWSPSAFNFSGTGSSTANNANPSAYIVNTGSLSGAGIAPGNLVQLTGVVAPYGTAPPAFLASSLVGGQTTPQTLVVEWIDGGGAAPFTSVSSAGLVVNLSSADIGSIHYIRTGPSITDLTTLPASPLITTQGADQSNLQLAVGSATVATTGIQVFNNVDEFATTVAKTFNGTNKIYRLVAYGQYDATTNQFVASRIYVALEETAATT